MASSPSTATSPAAASASVSPAALARKERGVQALKQMKGRTIGGFAIVDHLESGGMAEIFLAQHSRDSGFRKDVAVKILQERYADNQRVVRMFHEEARIAARLNHPSIVDVFDAGVQEGQHFIAMEHIEGRTLTELIRRGLEVSRPLPLPHAAFVCAQVAEGLAYMADGVDRKGERHAVVHRDITPTNIIISDRGHTKIIDFGIATDGRKGSNSEGGKAAKTALGGADVATSDPGAAGEDGEGGGVPGKYSYMSPEQVKGEPLDGRSDIFALGIILYEITLGRRLYRGAPPVVMKRIVEDRIRPPTFIERDYPPALELVVMRALEKRREDRYQSADEMCRDLDAFLGQHVDRIGDRQIAMHLRGIESEDALVTDAGARRAAAFMLEGADDEPLDFDRGDAFGMRTTGPVPEAPPARTTLSTPMERTQGAGAGESADMSLPVASSPVSRNAGQSSVGSARAGSGKLLAAALAGAAVASVATWYLVTR